MRKFALPVVALWCEGCGSCVTPSIPRDDGGDSVVDSAPETGDSTPPVDTRPEPECAVVEAEPNDYSPGAGGDPPTVLEMEEWACGAIGTTGDTDHLQVTTGDVVDWVRFDIVAAAQGSSLDANLVLPDETYGAAVEDSDVNSVFTEDSNDPALTFPVGSSPHTFDLVLSDADWLAGADDYHWKLRARSAKAPVSWTLEEVEPNDPALGGAAQSLGTDGRVLGFLPSAIDVDAYTFEVPAVQKEQGIRVTVDVDAYRFGSPAMMILDVADPSGTIIKPNDTHDEFGRKGDPYCEIKDLAAGTYSVYVNLREGSGSQAYWYVLGVTVEVLETAS
jgi:hypothetical protein